MKKNSSRIASIDIFRAATMLTMLWVNDFAGMDGIPHWMHHAKMSEDMMGFSDLVFPAFLFCMGLSIPFAVNSRLKKGESVWQIMVHIGLRAAALIVMGLCDMNSSSVGVLSHSWLWILAIMAFFMIWNDYPKVKGWRKWIFTGLQVTGVLILGGMATYRIANDLPIETGWWGILGLIGWAYFFSALIYVGCLYVRRQKLAVLVAWLAVVGIFILNSSGIGVLKHIYGGWVHIGLAFTGVATATAMQLCDEKGKRSAFPLWALGGAVIMLIAALVSHKFWIISKMIGTPTWMFFSLAGSLVFLAVFYWIADIKGHDMRNSKLAAIFLLPAGTATLTCYSLPYLTYNLREILQLWYPHAISYGAAGLAKSMVFAFVITATAWCLGKIGIKLKL